MQAQDATISMQKHNAAVICIFARLPIAGKAKTRLSATIGPNAAAEFYRQCAELVFQSAFSCQSADAVVFCSAPQEVDGMQDWLRRNGTPMPVLAQQQTPDLGQRMLAALTAAAAAAAVPSRPSSRPSSATSSTQQEDSNSCSPSVQQQQQDHQQQQQQYAAALVIGTDIPDLTPGVLDEAVAVLSNYEMVLGPARDGGFYLMGFRTEALLQPEVQAGQVFESVTWSTDSVRQRTAAGARRVGLQLAPLDALPVLRDIDTVVDLQDWFRTVTVAPGHPEQQPSLLELLAAPQPLQGRQHAAAEQQQQVRQQRVGSSNGAVVLQEAAAGQEQYICQRRMLLAAHVQQLLAQRDGVVQQQ